MNEKDLKAVQQAIKEFKKPAKYTFEQWLNGEVILDDKSKIFEFTESDLNKIRQKSYDLVMEMVEWELNILTSAFNKKINSVPNKIGFIQSKINTLKAIYQKEFNLKTDSRRTKKHFIYFTGKGKMLLEEVLELRKWQNQFIDDELCFFSSKSYFYTKELQEPIPELGIKGGYMIKYTEEYMKEAYIIVKAISQCKYQEFLEAELKKFNNQSQTRTPPPPLKSFLWRGKPEQLKNLYKTLVGTYIDAGTDFNDFNKIFSGEQIENLNKITWILKAEKNKMPDKKALITLFEFLQPVLIEKVNFNHLSILLTFLFKNSEGDFTQFTHSNRPNKINGFGDNWQNIKSIIDSL